MSSGWGWDPSSPLVFPFPLPPITTDCLSRLSKSQSEFLSLFLFYILQAISDVSEDGEWKQTH